jgi:hypothetical protein
VTIVFHRETHGAADGSGTTVTASYSSNSLGNLLWIGIGWEDTGVTDVLSVTDAAGNPWQSAIAKVRNAPANDAVRIFYVPTGCLTSAGANLITVTMAAACTFKRISGLEYRSTNGPWTSDMRDKTGSGTGNSKALLSSSVTPATADQLVGSFGQTGGFGACGASAPYTARATNGFTTATERILVGGLGVAVTGQATGTVSEQWEIATVTFADVGGTLIPPVAAASRVRLTNVSSSGKARTLLAGGR